MKIAFVTLVVFAGVAALVLIFGRLRWRKFTRALRRELAAAQRPGEAAAYAARWLDGLPAPVRRYFLAVLTEGQRPVAAVDLEQTGTFNFSETAEQWKPFAARQRVVTNRPGFGWDARIALLPALPVFVQDAYIAGEGLLRVAVVGLVTKADLRDRGELARGELMRFLAEAVWYPTALLPGRGVVWSPVDDHAACATLVDGDLTVTLRFHFDARNLIDTVRADARSRTAGTVTEFLPWQCRLWNYAVRDGLRVPLEGEAAWLTPAGEKPYWRGKITRLRYEFAP